MTEVIVQKFYKLMSNKKGDSLIAITEKEGKPKDPEIIYDGRSHAILYRNEDQTVILDYIHPRAVFSLKKQKEIRIAEFNDKSEMVNDYIVPINMVEKIPNIDKYIKQLTEEEKQELRDYVKSVSKKKK